MLIQFLFIGLVDVPLPWRADWAWGLPLIVLTVLIHVVGLAMTRGAVPHIFSRSSQRHPTALFVIVTHFPGNMSSRHRGDDLGYRVHRPRCDTQLPVGSALFAECHDNRRNKINHASTCHGGNGLAVLVRCSDSNHVAAGADQRSVCHRHRFGISLPKTWPYSRRGAHERGTVWLLCWTSGCMARIGGLAAV